MSWPNQIIEIFLIAASNEDGCDLSPNTWHLLARTATVSTQTIVTRASSSLPTLCASTQSFALGLLIVLARRGLFGLNMLVLVWGAPCRLSRQGARMRMPPSDTFGVRGGPRLCACPAVFVVAGVLIFVPCYTSATISFNYSAYFVACWRLG